MKVMDEIRRNVDALAAPAPAGIPTQQKGAGTGPAPPLFHGERRRGWAGIGEAMLRHSAAVELAWLRERVAELECQVHDAYDAGRRDERARQAKTHGGRLPSILSR